MSRNTKIAILKNKNPKSTLILVFQEKGFRDAASCNDKSDNCFAMLPGEWIIVSNPDRQEQLVYADEACSRPRLFGKIFQRTVRSLHQEEGRVKGVS